MSLDRWRIFNLRSAENAKLTFTICDDYVEDNPPPMPLDFVADKPEAHQDDWTIYNNPKAVPEWASRNVELAMNANRPWVNPGLSAENVAILAGKYG